MSTATVVVDVWTEGGSGARAVDGLSISVEIAQTLAAPLLLVFGQDALNLYAIQPDDRPQFLQSVKYGDLDQVTSLRESLGPRQLLEAKRGAVQLSLFPTDVQLLERAQQRTEERLSPRVADALTAAVEVTQTASGPINSRDAERLHHKAARLVVGSLTALVLRDKFELQLTPSALADASQQRYSEYFRWLQDTTERERKTFEALIVSLGEGVNYRSLDPRILSGIYESTLVSDALRRKLGTHYTPPGLARRIMNTLPVEYLAPGTRTVMDPTCGSGSLLLAAHDRLLELQPPGWNMTESHAYLSEHLRGFDSDAFAVEISRLSLLLHALPAGNGWDIQQRDTLTTTIEAHERPSLMLANPPWANIRIGGRRVERADEFLRWMTAETAEGGYLAVIMPGGWLNSRSSAPSREYFRQQCDLFEVWRLPEGVFEQANMAPVVIFAQKKRGQASNSWLFRRVVRSASLSRFYQKGIADESHLVARPTQLSGPLLTGALQEEFARRPDWPTLISVARVVTGPQPVSNLAPRPSGPGTCKFLAKYGSLSAFKLVTPEFLVDVRFPEDFQSGSTRGAEGLGRSKILASAARWPNNPWRLKVALDLTGALVRNSIQMILPHTGDEEFIYGLFAFLGSAFASAWIDESVSGRNISTADLNSLPIPRSGALWKRLIRLGKRLPTLDGSQVSEALVEVDRVVWKGLALGSEVQDAVMRRLAGFPSPEGSPRYLRSERQLSLPIDRRGRGRRRFGVTTAIDESLLQLDIPGATHGDGQWVAPPPGLTGLMARPGQTFGVHIPKEGDLDEAEYFYHVNSWMTEQELSDAVGS